MIDLRIEFNYCILSLVTDNKPTSNKIWDNKTGINSKDGETGWTIASSITLQVYDYYDFNRANQNTILARDNNGTFEAITPHPTPSSNLWLCM